MEELKIFHLYEAEVLFFVTRYYKYIVPNGAMLTDIVFVCDPVEIGYL